MAWLETKNSLVILSIYHIYVYPQVIFQNNQNRYAAEQIYMGAFDKTMFNRAILKGEMNYFQFK